MASEIATTDGAPSSQPPAAGAVLADGHRAVAAVQAAVLMAHKFPRDETAAFKRVLQACHRKALAEQALYAYKRGSALVEGPSIRLAEAIAQSWGNLEFGMREISQDWDRSEVEAYCWDLETNVRRSVVFTVPHVRYTKSDGRIQLGGGDPRDIYELVANMAARRVRACILAVIPGDVVEGAEETCRQTLAGASTEPLIDRVRKAVVYFGEQGVTQEMIERHLGHKLDACTETELVRLKGVAQALKDGFAKREDFFGPLGRASSVEVGSALESASDALDAASETAKERPAPSSKISDQQAQQIDGAVRGSGLTDDEVLALLERYGVSAYNDLSTTQYQSVLTELLRRPKKGRK